MSTGVGVLAACGSTSNDAVFSPDGAPGSGGSGQPIIFGSGENDGSPYDNSKRWADFGVAPFSDTRALSAAPAGAVAAFATTSTTTVSASASLCVFEPEAQVRYPRNWVAPRISFSVADADSNVVEVRVKAGNQNNDLV